MKLTWPAVALAIGVCLLAIFVATSSRVLLAALCRRPSSRGRGRARALPRVARHVDRMGLDRRDRARRRSGGRSSTRSPDAGRYSWYVTTTFFQDRMLEYGLWAAGALGDRARRDPARRRARVARPAQARARPRHVRLRRALRLVVRRLRPLHRGQGGLPLDELVDRHRRAEPHLPRAAPVHRHRARARAAGHSLVRPRSRRRFALYLVSSTPYSLETYPNYEAHGLAIAAFANRIPKWPAETIENIAAARGARIGLALVRRALRARSRPGRGRRHDRGLRAGLEPDDRGLRGERRERASDEQFATLAEAAELGRPRDGRRAVRVRRPGHQRPEPVLAARVLEPVDEVGLGRGRQHARRRDSEPAAAGRNAGSDRPRRRVCGGVEGRRDRRASRDDRRRLRPLPARRRAGAAARDDDRRPAGRLDELGGLVHALRRRGRAPRIREGDAVPAGRVFRTSRRRRASSRWESWA